MARSATGVSIDASNVYCLHQCNDSKKVVVSSTPAMNIVVPSQARSMPLFPGTEISEGTRGASAATDVHI